MDKLRDIPEQLSHRVNTQSTLKGDLLNLHERFKYSSANEKIALFLGAVAFAVGAFGLAHSSDEADVPFSHDTDKSVTNITLDDNARLRKDPLVFSDSGSGATNEIDVLNLGDSTELTIPTPSGVYRADLPNDANGEFIGVNVSDLEKSGLLDKESIDKLSKDPDGIVWVSRQTTTPNTGK